MTSNRERLGELSVYQLFSLSPVQTGDVALRLRAVARVDRVAGEIIAARRTLNRRAIKVNAFQAALNPCLLYTSDAADE